MSDLFGSPRRWIFRRRRLPQRRLAAERRCAAGQCNGYAHLSWRSADTGRGRDTRRKASGAKKRSDAHQDSRASPFVRRCPAASTGAQRAGSSRELARRAAHHVPPWSWARESPPEAEVELEPQAGLRHHRENSWLGLSQRVGHPRQPSRCVGERRAGPDFRSGGVTRGGPGPR